MFVTLVAVLCNTLAGPTYCVREAIETEAMNQIECNVHGQEYLASWMRGNPRYSHDWRVDSYRCYPGHYEIRGRA